jgi:3-oxoacyl-[acyl-carrier protein] reductase
MKLRDRVALITGAGSGLGRCIARTFAREGARIAVNDVSREAAERVVNEIVAAGGQAVALVADVSDSVDVRAVFEELIDHWGTLDILVNNAGIAVMTDAVRNNLSQMMAEVVASGRPSTSIGATRDMTDSHWRRTLSIHLDGTFYCTREALKIMESKRSGKIINMASIAGTTGLAGMPDYSAAKAGIIGLTKSVAREVVGLGIAVNAIAPGFIDTPLMDGLGEQLKQLSVLQTPIGRLGTPEEVAALALYLAGDESGFTVGQVISPNGGYYI